MNYDADFAEFWKAYPRRVGKLAARRAYEKARTANGATQEELLAGIATYVQHKPDYADFCHPSTWLNEGRWMDEPDTLPRHSSNPKTAGNFNNVQRWLERKRA